MKKPLQTGQPSKTPKDQGPTPPQRQGLKQSLLSLEPRLMFDAAAAATASEIATEQVAQEQADAAVSGDATVESGSPDSADSQDLLQAISTFMPAESRTEIVFVDPTVPNYQELLSGMDPNTEVVMLDGGQDGVHQMASALSSRTGIDAIHLISHGNSGELQLGTGTLNAESMSTQYASDLATIQHALSEQADILIYGCDFAEGETGQAAVNRLAEMTGADVEASNDLTGHSSLGGDWDLEVKTGTIETRIAIDAQVQADWMAILAAPTLDATKSPTLNSVSEDSGAPSGTAGTLVSSLVDFANPSGQVDNVTDSDAGAQLGIAITGANTSNGTWWYSTNNGSTWNALGAVSEGGARLLAADANTRLYFQANADYNGTMSDAITFRAWDQTSGTAGATANPTAASDTVKDQFSSASYSNNNGTANWRGSWVETDSGGGGASGGKIRIEDGQLDIRADTVNDGLYREVNLSNATSATLSFSYNNRLGSGDSIAVQVSSDGGAHYTTLTGGTFSNAAHTGSGTISFDITSSISASTRVRFLVTGEHDNDHLYVDNVQVSVSSPNTGGNTAFSNTTDTAALTVTPVNDAPTDLALSANSVAENATTSTVVGTVTGTDVDTGDTKTYSLTDTAGGRFAINSTTGVITVADGALLNYESATSHNVTVRVTDSGGLTYNETFTINLTNVNEAPSDLSLSANSVAENAATGTVVGTITGTDADAGDTKTYSLTDSAGGRFAINSRTGQITVADGSLLNYEQATSHPVTVQVTDAAGLTYNETFTINLTNVNEAPTGADATVTITEDTTHTLTTANFGFSDVDAGDSLSAVRIDTIPSAGSLTLSGVAVTAGQVISVADITGGNLVFTPAANANGTAYASVMFSVRDSNNAYDTAPNTLTLNVTAVDDAPINTVPGAQTVAVDTPLAISGLSVSDIDGNLTTVQLSVANGTVAVSLSGGATISAGASGTATLTLIGTQADINTTLGSLTYQGGALFTGIDTLTVLSTDGNGASDTDTVTITVSNNGPSNVLPAPQTVAEDTPLALSGLSVTDADGNLTTVQLSVSHGTVSVTLSGATTVSGGSNGSGTLTLSGTQAELNATLASLTYQGHPNFAGADTLIITSTDSIGTADADNLSITVTAVNDTPTDLGISSNLVVEHAPNGTTVGTVTPTDPDTGDMFTYQLTDTAGGRFTINATTGEITVADSSLLHYEVAASHDITVRVTDSVGHAYDKIFTINLIDINEAPTELTLSSNSVVENATNGTIVGTISGTDLDTGDSLTYALTDAAGGRFAINASTGQITVADRSLLNYESATSHSVTVRVTDSGGLTYDEAFTINLTNVNETPTDLALSANAVAENAATGTVVGTITGTDADAGDTKTYSLTDTAGGRFAINSSTGQITVADGSLLNYEAATSHSVTVRVTDSGGLTYDEAFTINLANVNETPTDLALSANTVAENATNGTVVGTITGTDPDSGDTKSYSLTDTAGGRFAINSSTGQITVADGSLLNYEAATSHSVTVRVTDSGGQTYDEAFTINLTNANEAPTGADATVTINEDTPHTLTSTNFGFSDVDAGDSLSAVRIDNLPTAGTLQLSGVDVTAGQVIAVADITAGNLVFMPAADANGTGYASFTFSVRDSNNAYNTAQNQLTFDVTPVNDTPIAGNDSYSIQEDGTLTVDVSSGLLATDMEIDGDVSTVILVNGPSNGTLHLSADGSFVYTPNANFSGTDTFSYKINDGSMDSNVASVTITVSPANDGPMLTTNSGSTVVEGGADTIDISELAVTDVDNAAAQLTYSVGTGPAHGRLEFTTAPGVSVTTFSQADIAANRLTYVHDGSETTSDSFTFTVSDGAGGTIGSTTLTLTITPVNDAPTIVSGGGGAHATYNVAENVSAVTIVTGADVDLSAQALTYSVSGGIDQALFTIDSNTGALSFVVPPDFEVPVDADGNNIYVVQVRVTDSQGATTAQTIQVTVTNLAEGVTPPSNNPLVPPSFVPTAQSGLPLPGTPPSGGLTPAPRASTVGEPTVTSPHQSEVPSAPTGFTLEEPRRTTNIVKDFAMPQWDTIPDPTPLSILPIDVAAPRDSEEPNPSEPVSAIPLEQLGIMADSLEEDTPIDQERDALVARITALTGATIPSGFVGLALRSGVLLAGCLATIPAWKRFATPSSRRREAAQTEPSKTQRDHIPEKQK